MFFYFYTEKWISLKKIFFCNGLWKFFCQSLKKNFTKTKRISEKFLL